MATLGPVVQLLSFKKKELGKKEIKSTERPQSGFESRHGRYGAVSPIAGIRIDIQKLIVRITSKFINQTSMAKNVEVVRRHGRFSSKYKYLNSFFFEFSWQE